MEAPRPHFTRRWRVRWVDTDTSGRIHFTALLRWFEWTEEEFLQALGFTHHTLRAQGVDIPRVRVEANYRAALRYGDEVEVGLRVERVGNASATFAYTAHRQDGVLAGDGRVTFCAVDLDTGRSRPLPQDLRQALLAARESQPQ